MDGWHSFQKTIEGNAFKGAAKEKPFKIATKSFLTLPLILPQDDGISGCDCYSVVWGVLYVNAQWDYGVTLDKGVN